MLWIPFLAQGSLWDSVKFQFQDRLSPSGMDASPDSTGVLEISTSWTVLGPFQIGTRGMRLSSHHTPSKPRRAHFCFIQAEVAICVYKPLKDLLN